MAYEKDLNLKETELRLGLPGTGKDEEQDVSCVKSNKRISMDISEKRKLDDHHATAPPAKTQIIGWPPVRSHMKNNNQTKKNSESDAIYVKVSMDGAPYLRKIDLKVYKGYPELLKALQTMFKFTIGEYSEREGYKGSGYVPTYEDKDGDWMLLGDVPWNMFMSSCKKLRVMKGSEAKGLGCGV